MKLPGICGENKKTPYGRGFVHRAAEMILFYRMASFRPFPGLNAGTFAAAISMASPVWGLRPVRAARSRTSKLPKPGICTLPFCFKVSRFVFCLVVDGFHVPFDDLAGIGVDGEFVLRAAVDDLALILRAAIIVVQLPFVDVLFRCA